jgi:hypothetical protein
MAGISVKAQYKGDWVLSVGVGYRTDESPVERPFIKPPNKLYDANDGTMKGWMGGWFTTFSLQKALFKNSLTGATFRPSFHHIKGDFFIMPNYVFFHDWYSKKKGIDHRSVFGIQITNNKTRVYSSGLPIFPGGPIINPFDYRAWGLGIRGGRLLAQKGVLQNTYLRGELTWSFGQRRVFPPYSGIQLGLNITRNILLNK